MKELMISTMSILLWICCMVAGEIIALIFLFFHVKAGIFPAFILIIFSEPNYFMAVIRVVPYFDSVLTVPKPGTYHSVTSMFIGRPMPATFIFNLLLYVILNASQL